MTGLKTKKEIRPGSEDDYFKIPIYMGDDLNDGQEPIVIFMLIQLKFQE